MGKIFTAVGAAPVVGLHGLLSRAGSGDPVTPELRLFYFEEMTDVPRELNPTTKNQTHKRTQNESLAHRLLKARAINIPRCIDEYRSHLF